MKATLIKFASAIFLLLTQEVFTIQFEMELDEPESLCLTESVANTKVNETLWIGMDPENASASDVMRANVRKILSENLHFHSTGFGVNRQIYVGKIDDSGQLYIPLWDRNQVLKWNVHEQSNFSRYRNKEHGNREIKNLFKVAEESWKGSNPIKLEYSETEAHISVLLSDQNLEHNGGYADAQAFMPSDSVVGNKIVLYPIFFQRGVPCLKDQSFRKPL